VLFARRRRRLLRFLTIGARNDPPSGTPRISGRTLLSLPEDVMVRLQLPMLGCTMLLAAFRAAQLQ
jgi:hypothetical protein